MCCIGNLNLFLVISLGYREVVEKFIVLTRGMGMGLLRLLCEGLGLRPNYFEGPLGGSETIIGLNHYPSCSNLDPGLGLGLPPHCDRNLITLLLPGAVPGLQVSYKGDRITVEPVPNAFVVNFGLQLELIHHFSTEQVVHSSIGGSNHHYICWFALAGCDQRGAKEH